MDGRNPKLINVTEELKADPWSDQFERHDDGVTRYCYPEFPHCLCSAHGRSLENDGARLLGPQ